MSQIINVEVNELSDADKQIHYEIIFGDNSELYTPEQAATMRKQILEMISIEGLEVAVGRVVARMVEQMPAMPQELIDGFYSAVLWLHRIHSDNN